MLKYLTTLEEFDVTQRIQCPHTLFYPLTHSSKIEIATLILSKTTDNVLLITTIGFSIDSVFAGLSEKHIEYIAKNGPKEYKKNLLKILGDKEIIGSALEIAKAMDEDLGEKVTQNQERVKNVIQYINDNRTAFEF